MMVRLTMVLILTLGTALPGACLAADEARDDQGAAAEEAPPVGSLIGDLRFKDIRYVTRSLQDLGERKFHVFVMSSAGCPLVQKYWPKLQRLHEAYREQGVQFVAVNVAPGDSIAEMAQQAIDFGVDFPFVKCPDGSCARRLGTTRTPEVAIVDAQRRLRFRGRIDDQHRLSGSRPDVADDTLARALDELLAGREPAAGETPVDGCLIGRADRLPPKVPVTYSEHVAPLIRQHCQECHHDRGGAPFPLVTYDEVTSHAAMIAEVVGEQRMPPWFAGRKHQFVNERGLSAGERRQIADWVAGGLAEGDRSLAPPPLEFHDDQWQIGQPDLVLTAFETHSLPAEGIVKYRYVIFPHVFTEETWISSAEILPSNPAVVHHCNMAHWTVGEKFDAGAFITGKVPGGTPMVLDEGIALKIPKNSVVGLQIHYTTTGKPETCRISVGFKFPRVPVRQELKHVQVTTTKFSIPPGAPAHPVVSSRTLPCDAEGLAMFSHMHLRGKDMTFIAHTPDGSQETLLSIPNYSFDWQQNYRWKPGTKTFPKGTRIEVIAHFDNSPFNPFNPDATATVRVGEQTFNEMMFGFFFYTDQSERLDLTIDSKTGRAVEHAR